MSSSWDFGTQGTLHSRRGSSTCRRSRKIRSKSLIFGNLAADWRIVEVNSSFFFIFLFEPCSFVMLSHVADTVIHSDTVIHALKYQNTQRNCGIRRNLWSPPLPQVASWSHEWNVRLHPVQALVKSAKLRMTCSWIVLTSHGGCGFLR